MPAALQASMSSVPAGAVIFWPSTVKVTSGIQTSLVLRLLDQDLLVSAVMARHAQRGPGKQHNHDPYDNKCEHDEVAGPRGRVTQCPAPTRSCSSVDMSIVPAFLPSM